MKRKLWSTP